LNATIIRIIASIAISSGIAEGLDGNDGSRVHFFSGESAFVELLKAIQGAAVQL
jgi:hypothetical protein